jgi:hypothetical protein
MNPRNCSYCWQFTFTIQLSKIWVWKHH